MSHTLRLAALAAALCATPVLAAAPQSPSKAEAAPNPGGPRYVLVCERPEKGRRVFSREHGELTFVSTRDLTAPASAGATPRCITAGQLRALRSGRGGGGWSVTERETAGRR